MILLQDVFCNLKDTKVEQRVEMPFLRCTTEEAWLDVFQGAFTFSAAPATITQLQHKRVETWKTAFLG